MARTRSGSVKINKLGGELRDTASAGVGRRLEESLYPTSTAKPVELIERAFTSAGAIPPPFPPATLAMYYEHSSALRPNVDSYAQNIDGFGHHLEPVLDFDKSTARQILADELHESREIVARERARIAGTPPPDVPVPTEAEIDAEKARVVAASRREHRQLTDFFENIGGRQSFTKIRKLARTDLETIGYAFFEVLRDSTGTIVELVHVPAFTMRLTAEEREPTIVTEPQKKGLFGYVQVRRRRSFRRYVQVLDSGSVVYFKEFGDPRLISRASGRVVPQNEGDALERNANDGPANEVIYMRIESSRTPYGIPRWIGTLLSVLGQRQAEEVNASYFDNKSVPPLAILVSGGTLAPSAVQYLTDYMDREIRGAQNFHKVLVIEAVPAEGSAVEGGAAKVGLELKPLTDAQQKDGLFLEYDERASDKIGTAFRLPRILRGVTTDFNRATADAAMVATEAQVFAPERVDFDFMINRRIFADLGIRYWKFVSDSPPVGDPIERGNMVIGMVDKGLLTPAEGRDLAAEILGRELAPIAASWAQQPLALTLAGIVSGANGDPQAYTGDDVPLGAERAPYEQDTTAAEDVERPQVTITPTMLGSIVTVNEARGASRLPPLLLEDGTPDPDGNLSITEFNIKRGAGAAGVAAPGAAAFGKGRRPGTVDLESIMTGKGIGYRPSTGPATAPEQHAAFLIRVAADLRKRAADEANVRFLRAKFADGVPPEIIEKAFPRDVIEALR